jgi:NRPS condensation-like uncharacterized protein
MFVSLYFPEEPDQILKNVGNRPENYYPHVFHEIKQEFSVSKLKAAGKLFGFTINDIILAALVAGYYRLHKSNGKSVSKCTISFVKNFRTYSPPLSLGNDWQNLPVSIATGDVSVELIGNMQKAMNEYKQ